MRPAPAAALQLAAIVIACLNSNPAVAGPQLAAQRNCLACHAVDRRVLGPAYQDVADRYAGQPDAAPRLARKIVTGGTGVWGRLVMPANPQVSEAEARQLVQWILSLKKPSGG